MKNSSKRIFTLIILFVSVLVFSTITASAAVASVPQTYTTADESMEIETKYKKASTNKITFKSNGGKIGSKNTVAMNIKKGAKIKKFPTTPKRTGYEFKGWYSKKAGGKKISVNTKPTKSITLYAQWTKKGSSNTLNAEEKKLVGRWSLISYNIALTYTFNNDGSFIQVRIIEYSYPGTHYTFKGNWRASGDTIYLTNQMYQTSYDGGRTYGPWKSASPPSDSMKIHFGSDEKGQYFSEGGDLKYYKGK